MKIFSNPKGFTLVEAIIAIFIITIGIVAVLQLFPVSLQQQKMAEMSTVASQLGQEKIEEILSQSYETLSTGTTTENYGTITGFSAFKRETRINCVNSNLQSVACNYDSTNDPNPLKKIEMTVYWKSPLGISERSFKIATLITKK